MTPRPSIGVLVAFVHLSHSAVLVSIFCDIPLQSVHISCNGSTGSLKSKRMPPGTTQKCDACLEQAILEFFRPDSSRRSKSGHSSMFFKSSFDYSSGNMAVACTIRRNKRSFYRRVHVDKLATPHSLDLMNVISRLYGDTML